MHIEKDIDILGDIFMQRMAEEGSIFVSQETRDQIEDIERRMEEFMQMCKQRVRAYPRKIDGDDTERILL